MAHWRLLVHALDRTGPPMLARSLLRSWRAVQPDATFDVIAFRGGAMFESFAELAPTTVLLDDAEHWDHDDPDPERVAAITERARDLAPAHASVLVSVAGGQCLALLREQGTIITWVVEQGADLHWLEAPVGVRWRTNRWMAGSTSSRDELRERLGPRASIELTPEFVDPPDPDAGRAGELRMTALGDDTSALVLGAGIGTWRKAPDLFVEVAAAYQRRAAPPARFVWVGGERDPLIPRLRALVDDLDLADVVRFVDNDHRIDDWMEAADVLCHPARLDAFPLVCILSAACATPVVAFSGVGGITEMMGSSFVGSEFPDVAGMVDRLVEVLSGDPTAVGAQQADAVSRFLSTTAAPQAVETILRLATASSPSNEVDA